MISFKGTVSLRKEKPRIGQDANIDNQIKTKAWRLFCGRQLTSRNVNFHLWLNRLGEQPWEDRAQATFEKPASECCL